MSLKLSLVSSAALLMASTALAAPMIGFSAAGAEAERATEAKFDAVLSADAMRDRLKLMSSQPNQVGSPHDKENAEYTLAQYKAWGWDAHIETFSVLYPTPKQETLELGGDHPFTATLTEPAIAGDTSEHQQGGLPAYFAYGGEGDVTAPLIYVNYGMPSDYEALRRMGLDVKGKIVIARYGAGWRGLKPKLAQEHGAVGCIVYSDPADDGYGTDDPYPNGPSRPERGLQRGSVQDLPVEPGDPLTPGYGATPGAPRIARADAKTILKIPAVPISWGDAQVFLRALGGPVAPKAWRGALPITYHVGGGPEAPTHLVVFSNWNQAPLYDVIATMKGAKTPDEWVIRGNHRDGWVFGAEDPLSGQIAEMEEAKAIGALAKTGWRPDRTLIYTSWDGEEPGLLGSTEWAETHAKDLQDHAVVYINTDGNGRGLLSAEASYGLRSLVDNVAADVRDPETGASVRDRARAAIQVQALAPGASAELKADAKLAAADGDLPLGSLGSGSDYTPFVQHLGVASINLGYSGEGESGGVYHSAYDTFEHFSRFGDPGFVYSVVLAKTAGRLVLRAADAKIAPFRFADLASSVAAQTAELKTLATNARENAATTDTLIDSQAFHLAADPTLPSGAPERLEPVPTLDFTPLDAAVARLTASAAAYDAASKGDVGSAAAARADLVLQGVEQTLTDARGLPGRPWYRHMIYAPGLLTGYGSKTLPGVREAIESRRWAEAAEMIGRTASTLDAASARIDQATAALR